MSNLSKENVVIYNRYLCIIIKLLPEYLAIKLLRMIKKIRRNKALVNHREGFKRITKKEKVCIVFIVYKPQLWNSFKTVYLAAVQNKLIKTHVIVVDDETKLSDGSSLMSYDYYLNQCPGAIKASDGKKCFDIKSLKPDIIFRQTPYDHVYPDEYSMERLSRIAKTCYIPYNYNFTPNHLYIEYNDLLLSNLYGVFSDCKTNYNYCENERTNWYPDLHVYNLGFPRFDIARKIQKKRDQIESFLWIPSWNTDNIDNDGTSFFKYKDNLLSFFEKHKDLKLIIRPHPNMFENFINKGLMTVEEIDLFYKRIADMNNVTMDDNMDYLMTFEVTDALIADMSSIVYEFYLTGKPIIYCGNPSHYNKETKKMMEYAYRVSSWGKLKRNIEMLACGIDENNDKRKRDIKKTFLTLPYDIGEAIVQQCICIAKGKEV